MKTVTSPFHRPGVRAALLQTVGLGLISFSLGMWLLPVGIAAAGVSLLVLAALGES